MKIVFSEHVQNSDDMQFGYSIQGLREQNETISDVLRSGWMPHTALENRTYMARQIRVDVERFTLSAENRRVLRRLDQMLCVGGGGGVGSGDCGDDNNNNDCCCRALQMKLLSVESWLMSNDDVAITKYTSYATRKWNCSVEKFKTICNTVGTHIVEFPQMDSLFILHMSKKHQLVWVSNVFLNEKSFGVALFTHLILFLQQQHDTKHLYLGTIANEANLYKTNFQPFEWWDGVRWVDSNARELRRRCSSQEQDHHQQHVLETMCDEEQKELFDVSTVAIPFYRNIGTNKVVVYVAGGGTGGHFYPAMRIVNRLRLQSPKCSVTYFGCSGNTIEDKWFRRSSNQEQQQHQEQQQQQEHQQQELQQQQEEQFKHHLLFPMRRQTVMQWLTLPFVICINTIVCLYHMKHNRPTLVIGTGAYGCFIPMLCASLLRIPKVLFEQNYRPGLVSRLFPECVIHPAQSGTILKQEHITRAMSVRENFAFPRREQRDNSHLPWRVLVRGGSLSSFLKPNVVETLSKEFANVQWWVSDTTTTSPQLNKKKCAGKPLLVFFDSSNPDEMHDKVYPNIDIAVCYAGGTTIAELQAYGIPAVLLQDPTTRQNGDQSANIFHMCNIQKSCLFASNEFEIADKLKQIMMHHEELSARMYKNGAVTRADTTMRIINNRLFLSTIRC